MANIIKINRFIPLLAAFFFSCTAIESSSDLSSSSAGSDKYCIYAEARECFPTSQTTCPAGGELSDFCPYRSSSSVASSSSARSSSSSARSSSSSTPQPSSSSAPLPSSSSLAYSSSSSIVVSDLIRKNITLSYSGNSYADLDGNVTTYKQADAKSRLDKIDLIAHCGTNSGWCEKNSIYSPYEIDLFWTNFYEEYLGGDIYLYEIPPAQADIFKTAENLSEIIPTLNDLIPIFNSQVRVDEIPIVEGKVFFCYSSEEEIRIVIIKAANTQSVDLEIILVPT